MTRPVRPTTTRPPIHLRSPDMNRVSPRPLARPAPYARPRRRGVRLLLAFALAGLLAASGGGTDNPALDGAGAVGQAPAPGGCPIPNAPAAFVVGGRGNVPAPSLTARAQQVAA